MYGDPLPAGAVARFGPLHFRESNHVHSIAFAPDGKLIASSGWEGRIHLWDARTGGLVRTMPSRLENTLGTNSVPCVAFAPDGKRLLSGHRDGSTRMWDTASGKEHWRSDMKSHGGVNAVAYAPDGKVVASSYTGSPTRIWDAETGKELLRLEEDSTSSLSLAFSADSKLLISGEPFRVRLWDLKARKVRRTFSTFQNWVRGVALSPDGKLLAAGSNYPNSGLLRVWEVDSGKELLSRDGPYVNSVAFTPDGKTLVSAGMGISAWEVGAWKQRQPQFAPSSQISPAVAISPDGRTLAGGMWSGAIQLWDLETGKKIPCERGHLLSVSALEVTPDGKALASWGQDQTLNLWDLATGKEMVRRGKANSAVLNWHEYEVGISKDGRLLATLDMPYCFRLTELRTGKDLGRLNHEGKVVYRVALAPDGKSLASVTDDSLWLWDPISKVAKYRIALGNLKTIGPLHFSSDGKLLSLGRRLWQVETRRELRRFDEARDGLDEVLFSPDGRKLATANRLAMRLCEQFLGEEGVDADAVAALATGLLEHDLDVGWGVETVLRSRAFFAAANLGNRVLAPVEYVVGAARALELSVPTSGTLVLADWCGRLGQDLFQPPNVGGWPGGRRWISPQLMIARANYAAALVKGTLWTAPQPLDALALAKRHDRGGDLRDLIAFYGDLLLPGKRPDDRVEAAVGAKTALTAENARRAVILLLASPEAQMA
jgi:WD40 repeat protein